MWNHVKWIVSAAPSAPSNPTCRLLVFGNELCTVVSSGSHLRRGRGKVPGVFWRKRSSADATEKLGESFPLGRWSWWSYRLMWSCCESTSEYQQSHIFSLNSFVVVFLARRWNSEKIPFLICEEVKWSANGVQGCEVAASRWFRTFSNDDSQWYLEWEASSSTRFSIHLVETSWDSTPKSH